MPRGELVYSDSCQYRTNAGMAAAEFIPDITSLGLFCRLVALLNAYSNCAAEHSDSSGRNWLDRSVT